MSVNEELLDQSYGPEEKLLLNLEEMILKELPDGRSASR